MTHNEQQYTPMIQQYLNLKKKHSGLILLFRLGDFYEMFFEDAHTAAKILAITLTAREAGKGVKVPMCGVPYHSASSYITKLIKAGYHVGICEQMEDPTLSKGLVKREITRIITPSTHIDETILGEKNHHFLVSIVHNNTAWAMAILEPTTGDFILNEYSSQEMVFDELVRLNPKEIILPDNDDAVLQQLEDFLAKRLKPSITKYEEWIFTQDYAAECIKQHFQLYSLKGLEINKGTLSIQAAGAIFYFLKTNLFTNLEHIKPPRTISKGDFMVIDWATQRNLEILAPVSGENAHATLLSVLDQTATSLGGRLLRTWLSQPLVDISIIHKRHDAVEEYIQHRQILTDIREHLKPIKDIERIIARINNMTAHAKDLIGLKESLLHVPLVKKYMHTCTCPLLTETREKLLEINDLTTLLEVALEETPPLSLKEGGLIKKGYHQELDALKMISHNAKTWMTQFQEQEIKRTGIKSLKVRYNKIFGYYIEISNANLSAIPLDYTRKQTLVNAERFITPQLKEYEEKILTAEERIHTIEYELFLSLCEKIRSRITDIQTIAQAIATLDVLSSFAFISLSYGYHRPMVDDSDTLFIEGGRHPVIERLLLQGEFVENNVLLDRDTHQLLIITGPNMAGKSTYIRQVALIVIMAQIGCFIPASKAHIGVVDRIFTRIGASDNLSQGQSTFMVEMIETAHILNYATSRSLVILDEIGRGTSTFDGLSIAWAVTEFLSDLEQNRPRTLFATHYHELTELESMRKGIQNISIAVKEYGNKIIFLRKIVQGGTDKSYGIHVAELAGIPKSVIKRAREILQEIEKEKIALDGSPRSSVLSKNKNTPQQHQYLLDLDRTSETPNPIKERLKEVHLDEITPLEALSLLHEIAHLIGLPSSQKERIKNEKSFL